MINEFVDKINGYYKVTDGRSKIISLCLVSCYNKITPEKALDVKIILISKSNYNT